MEVMASVRYALDDFHGVRARASPPSPSLCAIPVYLDHGIIDRVAVSFLFKLVFGWGCGAPQRTRTSEREGCASTVPCLRKKRVYLYRPMPQKEKGVPLACHTSERKGFTSMVPCLRKERVYLYRAMPQREKVYLYRAIPPKQKVVPLPCHASEI